MNGNKKWKTSSRVGLICEKLIHHLWCKLLTMGPSAFLKPEALIVIGRTPGSERGQFCDEQGGL